FGAVCSPPPSSFYFPGPADHRDLHSFPTRRSSDLDELARSGPARQPADRRDDDRTTARREPGRPAPPGPAVQRRRPARRGGAGGDRKSTRLNSSHVAISYAVFCLKKKKKHN